MGKLKNCLVTGFSALDHYGPTISLKLHGNYRYKTVLGAFITVLTIGAAFALTATSFSNYFNLTNPTLSNSIEYDLSEINFNYTNFYFGVSFYDPVNTGDAASWSIKENNYSTIKYINQLNMTCETCQSEYQSSMLYLCAADQFANKTIKSMSTTKSEVIMNIFTNYSFCFPEDINGTIKDVQSTGPKAMDTTLSVYIPVSTTAINLDTVKQNTLAISSTGSTTKVSNISPSRPSATTKPQNQNTNSTGSANPFSQTRPKSGTSTGGSQQGKGSTAGAAPGHNSTSQGSTVGGTVNPGARILQTASSTSSSTIVRPQINTQMQDLISSYQFPKMFIIDRSFQLNPGTQVASDFFKYVYNLFVINYKDPITGNPIVYDIYVQKKKVITTKPDVFSSKVETLEILSIQRIEQNVFDSLQNNGAYFQFKLYSDVEVTNVKYVLLSDVLSVFGSYFASFSLIGAISSSVYADIVIQSSIINQIFKFVDNDPNDFSGMDLRIQKMMREEKLKRDYELKLAAENEKEERMQNYRSEIVLNNEEKQNLSLNEPPSPRRSFNNDEEDPEKPIILNEIYLDQETQYNLIQEKLKTSNKIAPMAEIEMKSLDEKVNKIQKMEENVLFSKKSRLVEIYELNKLKKKKRKLVTLKPYNMLMTLSCCKRCVKPERIGIWKKVFEIMDENLHIDKIIKTNLDFQQLKKMIFSPKQNMLFKYYMKHVNYANVADSRMFLNELSDDSKLDKDELERNEYEIFKGKVNNIIYDNFKTTYNF